MPSSAEGAIVPSTLHPPPSNLSHRSTQGAPAQLDPLIDESGDDHQSFLDRRLIDALRAASNGALDLFTQYAPLASQRLVRPAEACALSAVALGNESLDLGPVGHEYRRLSARFLDG